MTDDYTMKVPKELQEMAMKIEDWFLKQNIHTWALMNVCSRNHIQDIDYLRQRLENVRAALDV